MLRKIRYDENGNEREGWGLGYGFLIVLLIISIYIPALIISIGQIVFIWGIIFILFPSISKTSSINGRIKKSWFSRYIFRSMFLVFFLNVLFYRGGGIPIDVLAYVRIKILGISEHWEDIENITFLGVRYLTEPTFNSFGFFDVLLEKILMSSFSNIENYNIIMDKLMLYPYDSSFPFEFEIIKPSSLEEYVDIVSSRWVKWWGFLTAIFFMSSSERTIDYFKDSIFLLTTYLILFCVSNFIIWDDVVSFWIPIGCVFGTLLILIIRNIVIGSRSSD